MTNKIKRINNSYIITVDKKPFFETLDKKDMSVVESERKHILLERFLSSKFYFGDFLKNTITGGFSYEYEPFKQNNVYEGEIKLLGGDMDINMEKSGNIVTESLEKASLRYNIDRENLELGPYFWPRGYWSSDNKLVINGELPEEEIKEKINNKQKEIKERS